MSKTRQIEMYAGNNSGRWWTEEIEIPASTPEDQVEAVALEVYQQQLNERGAEIAIMGVHWVPELEDEQEDTDPWAEHESNYLRSVQ